MKRVVLMALVAIFTLSFTLEAQNNTRNRRDTNRQGPQTERRLTAKDRADAMAKDLKLSADQTAKVQALFEKQDAEREKQVAAQQAEREKTNVDRSARREEMQAAREKAMAKNDAELEKIIGKEKIAEWKKLREERQKALREDNRQERGRTPSPR